MGGAVSAFGRPASGGGFCSSASTRLTPETVPSPSASSHDTLSLLMKFERRFRHFTSTFTLIAKPRASAPSSVIPFESWKHKQSLGNIPDSQAVVGIACVSTSSSVCNMQSCPGCASPITVIISASAPAPSSPSLFMEKSSVLPNNHREMSTTREHANKKSRVHNSVANHLGKLAHRSRLFLRRADVKNSMPAPYHSGTNAHQNAPVLHCGDGDRQFCVALRYSQ